MVLKLNFITHYHVSRRIDVYAYPSQDSELHHVMNLSTFEYRHEAPFKFTVTPFKSHTVTRLNTIPIPRKNPIFIQRRYFTYNYQRELHRNIMLKITLTSEIEKLYNQDWKTKGILPHNKIKLQDKIKNEEYPMFNRANFNTFSKMELTTGEFKTLKKEAEAGWCFVNIVKEDDCDMVHLYEMDKAEDSLLLMGMVSILMKLYFQRSASIPKPKRLTKIRQLHECHYDFMNNQVGVESVHQIILEPIFYDKNFIREHINKIFRRKNVLSYILHEYINIPIYNLNSNNYININHAPPLGDIQTCVNHIVNQYVFDRPFCGKYPKIVFTRCDQEVFIVNYQSSNNKITELELNSFLDSLKGISGHVNSIYRTDAPEPEILEGYVTQQNYNGIVSYRKGRMQILLQQDGTISVNNIIEY